jgi:hypothetical protein
MTVRFKRGADGVQEIPIDPSARKDYSVIWSDWLGTDTISTSAWTITPAVASVPYTPGINGSPVVVDGVTYPANTVTTSWVKDLTAGVSYLVTNRVTTAAGRVDDYSFRLLCREQ